MIDLLPSPAPVSALFPIPLLVRGLGWSRKYHLLALLVMAVALAVTYQLWRSSARHALHEMQSQFDFSVREASARIEQRMEAYEQVLHSARDESAKNALLLRSAKQAAQQLHHLAHFDLLTNLPNRALLRDRLQQSLGKARRNNALLALMFLDLDKFKAVNGALGHDVGDLLLQEAAVRMKACLRESDTVARVGGDEFVVLLASIESEQDARMVAQKILSVLEQTFELAGHEVHISASIGIAIYHEHGADENLLIKSADQAMYHIKHLGGSSLISYGDLACPTLSTPFL